MLVVCFHVSDTDGSKVKWTRLVSVNITLGISVLHTTKRQTKHSGTCTHNINVTIGFLFATVKVVSITVNNEIFPFNSSPSSTSMIFML